MTPHQSPGEHPLGRVQLAVHRQASRRRVGLGREIRAHGRHHRPLHRQALVGGSGGIRLRQQRATHGLGVGADRAQLGRTCGHDHLLAPTASGDVAQLHAQVVQRSEHPAAHEEVRGRHEGQQGDTGCGDSEGEPSRHGGEVAERRVAGVVHGLLKRGRGRAHGPVGRGRRRDEVRDLRDGEWSLHPRVDGGLDHRGDPLQRRRRDVAQVGGEDRVGSQQRLQLRGVGRRALDRCVVPRPRGGVAGEDERPRLPIDPVVGHREVGGEVGGRRQAQGDVVAGPPDVRVRRTQHEGDDAQQDEPDDGQQRHPGAQAGPTTAIHAGHANDPTASDVPRAGRTARAVGPLGSPGVPRTAQRPG